jgi:hypothetical protein
MKENDRGSVGVAAFEIVQAQTVDIDETPDRRVASLRALRDDDNDDRSEEAADKYNQDENFDEGHGGAMTSFNSAYPSRRDARRAVSRERAENFY